MGSLILKVAGKRYLQKMHFRHPNSSEKVPYWGYLWHIEICKNRRKSVYFCFAALVVRCSFAFCALSPSSFKFSLNFWCCFLKKRFLSLEVTSHKYVELSTFAGYSLNMSWWYRPPAVAHFELHAFFRICSPVPQYKSKIAGRRCALPRGPSINKSIKGPLGRAHRRPAIFDLYFGTGLQIRRKSMQFEMGDCRRTVSSWHV